MTHSEQDTYALTEKDIAVANKIAGVGAGITLIMTTLVICLSIWIYRTPSARHHINRVSFRLLLWICGAEWSYALSYIVLFGNYHTGAGLAKLGLCPPGVYFLLASANTVNWFCVVMSLNLFLTICLGVDPIRLPPAAMGHFGFDPLFGQCYFATVDHQTRLRRYLSDIFVWEGLAGLLSVIAIIITLFSIWRQSGRCAKAVNANTLTLHNSFDETSPDPATTPRRSEDVSLDELIPLGHLDDSFLRIALRISLYPIVLICLNATFIFGDLYFLLHTVDDKDDYRFFLFYDFLWGGRGIFITCLIIFADPGLLRGVKAAWRARHDSASPPRSMLDLPSTPGLENQPTFFDMISYKTPDSANVALFPVTPDLTKNMSLYSADSIWKSPINELEDDHEAGVVHNMTGGGIRRPPFVHCKTSNTIITIE